MIDLKLLVRQRVITQALAAPGLAVLAPLRGAFTSLVCLTDLCRWNIHVPAPPFARVLRALLAYSLSSALRNASPGAAPASSLASVRVVKKGTLPKAMTPLLPPQGYPQR